MGCKGNLGSVGAYLFDFLPGIQRDILFSWWQWICSAKLFSVGSPLRVPVPSQLLLLSSIDYMNPPPVVFIRLRSHDSDCRPFRIQTPPLCNRLQLKGTLESLPWSNVPTLHAQVSTPPLLTGMKL